MSTPLASRLWVVGFAAAFAVAFTTHPLYTSNQNAYFLHGLADAGIGELARDWTARTTDPFPVFSTFVRLAAGHSWLFVGAHLAAVAAFGVGLLGVTRRALAPVDSRAVLWTAAALLIFTFSRVFGWAGDVLPGDIATVFQGGMAEQYLVGGYLEPSTAGVLLVYAVWAGMAGRVVLAAVVGALAATIHPTYIMSAGVITLVAGLVSVPRRSGFVRGSVASAVALVPILIYVGRNFGGSPDADVARAILVNERIPHHARPDVWFGWSAFLQFAWVAVAASLRSRLRPWLWAGLSIIVVGTVVTWLTHDNRLALLFPWRLSTWVVPLATALVLMRVAVTWPSPRWVAAGVIVFSVLIGAYRVVDRFTPAHRGFNAFAAEVPAFVADPDQALVLVPEHGVIRFRLATGLPVVADWKSHPYRFDEVVEWDRRLDLIRAFESADGAHACVALDRLLDEFPITHVVTKERGTLVCPRLELLTEVEGFSLYRAIRFRN